MDKLERTRQTIGEALEELRARIFLPDVRERYKLTFIARIPGEPEMDILVTEDDRDGLSALLDRRLGNKSLGETITVAEGRCTASAGCGSCGEVPPGDCPKSRRSCGHHCDCSWTLDTCCWCGQEFGEDGEAP